MLTPEEKERQISARRRVTPALRRARQATNAALAQAQTPDRQRETSERQIEAARDFLEVELSEWHQTHRPLGERYGRCQARLERTIIDGRVHAAALLPSKGWRYLSASECREFEAPWRVQQKVDGILSWLLVDEADVEGLFGGWAPEPAMEAAASIQDAPAPASAKLSRGRTPQPYWEEAEREALRWLDENGYTGHGSGDQAALERHIAEHLSKKDHHPSKSRLRDYCRGWIADFVAQRRGR